MAFLRVFLLLIAPLAAACLAETPQEAEPAVQGDYEDGNEEHRPGQPCLLCHSSDGHLLIPPGRETFEVAGTVYGTIDADEDDGLNNVEIIFTDARGDQFTASSNRAGNFYIEEKLVYPLEVTIRRGDDEQRMKTKIWRNGSCAHCHGPTPGADSVGRVYLFSEGITQ